MRETIERQMEDFDGISGRSWVEILDQNKERELRSVYVCGEARGGGKQPDPFGCLLNHFYCFFFLFF